MEDHSTAVPGPAEISHAEIAGLVDLARRIAQGAGDLIHSGRRAGVGVSATKSSPTDVVTALDTESERFIRDAITAARPADGILGEEYGLEPGSSGLTWVIDPIDGTVNFLYGSPAYAVSIAVVAGRAGEPGAYTLLAGCVHAPAQGRTYTAGRGLGASRWETSGGREGPPRPLRVNAAVPLDRALIGTGFGYRAVRRAAQGRVVAELLPRVRDIRRVGSAALDLSAVAAGELDGYFERGLKPWDLAAGALVVAEAGGVVRGLDGRPAGESMTIAGAPELVDNLTVVLEGLAAESDAPEE